MPGSVIVAGARTPIGKLSGALSGFSAQDLGGFAIAAALERAGVAPDQVDYVLMGQVLQAGQGQITARQAAAKAGIPMTVPGHDRQQGLPVRAQHHLPGRPDDRRRRRRDRGGRRHGVDEPGPPPAPRAPAPATAWATATLVDSMMFDGLTCAFDHCAMGLATERYNNATAKISRERQDAFAAASHEQAAAAAKEGRLADEIVPVEVPQRQGDPIVVDTDEGVRPGTTTESLGGLRPAFDKEGTITAGQRRRRSPTAAPRSSSPRRPRRTSSASPRSASSSRYGQVAGPDTSLLSQPANAIHAGARAKAGLSIGDIDLFEINEAFAAVGLASAEHSGIAEDMVNVNGGAIALGHPIGMSGTRLALTALLELRRRGGGLGRGGAVRRRRPGRRVDRPLAQLSAAPRLRRAGRTPRSRRRSAARPRSQRSIGRLNTASPQVAKPPESVGSGRSGMAATSASNVGVVADHHHRRDVVVDGGQLWSTSLGVAP